MFTLIRERFPLFSEDLGLTMVVEHLRLLWYRAKLAFYRLLSRPSPHEFEGYRLRFFRLGIPLVLKTSFRLVSTEADALRFLNKAAPHLPIPKLVDTFQISGNTYTLMTKLPGKDLQKQEDPPQEVMDDIAKDILDIVDELWRIPQPPHLAGKVIASASGHGLPHPAAFFEYNFGPWDNMRDCLESMQVDLQNTPPEVLNPLLEDRIVFVHTDLTMRNVLVQNGRVSGIIDWEDAGWCPSYWLPHVLRWLRPGCEGIWARHWIAHRFDPSLEEAYEASKKVLIYPLA